jgi:hypothetical protein
MRIASPKRARERSYSLAHRDLRDLPIVNRAVPGVDFPTRAVIRKPVAVPALTEALAAPQPSVRVVAARALSQFGPPAGKTVEALRKALNDDNAEVRQAVAETLLVENE